MSIWRTWTVRITSIAAFVAAASTLPLAPARAADAEIQPQTARASTGDAPKQPIIIVSENRALIRLEHKYPFNPFNETVDAPCMVFRVQAATSSIEGVWITSSGIGTAKFAALSKRSCSEAGSIWTPSLVLKKLDSDGQFVGLIADVTNLAGPGLTASGNIIVGKHGEAATVVPVKVEIPPIGPVTTAFGWFVGVVIPALIAWLLSLGAVAMKKRSDDGESFSRYRYANHQSISDFFRDVYTPLRNNPNFVREVYRRLISTHILENLPSKEQRKLWYAAQANDQQQFRVQLVQAFPEFANEIG